MNLDVAASILCGAVGWLGLGWLLFTRLHNNNPTRED